jgi:rhamnosyltransferase
VLTSIVIRTLNEERHLPELLSAIARQKALSTAWEVVIVDSGSTDKTMEIATSHGCRITHIAQEEFTFGRSLNVGCQFAKGEILVFISGHCIPTDEFWLEELVRPLVDKKAHYVYGRQEGFGATKFSEKCHFDKWFPRYSKIPQADFFCNNANAALARDVWENFKFDEELTGLEDMHLGRTITEEGLLLGYVATASVYHIHEESWRQVRLRYEREAIALQSIMPEVHFSLGDFFRFLTAGIFSDFSHALKEKQFFHKCGEIVAFRCMQYWGAYKGNHEHRKLSYQKKHSYFYPRHLGNTTDGN